MKKIALLFVLGALLTCFVSCDISFDFSQGGNTHDTVKIVDNNALITDEMLAYEVHSECSDDTPVDSFTDGEYNYFLFKIGEVDKVPIYYENKQRYSGIGEYSLSFSTEETNTNTIQTANSNCISKTVSVGNKTTANFQALKQTAKLAMEMSNSISSTSSTSKTITNTITNTIKQQKATTYKLSSDCPAGYYRFTVYGTCDIFAVVASSPEDKTYDIEYVPFVKPESIEEGWYYSQDGSFENDRDLTNTIEKLEFDDNLLQSIDLYEKLDDVRFLNKIKLSWPNVYGVTTKTAKVVTLELTDYFDFTAISNMGYNEIHFDISYGVKTSSGTCKATGYLYCSAEQTEEHQLFKRTDTAGGTLNECNGSGEFSIERIAGNDYKMKIVFTCAQNGSYDVLKNSYNVENLVLQITFK